MIEKLYRFLFTPIKVKTAEECKADFEACYESAFAGAVADVARVNGNGTMGHFLSQKGMQERCKAVLQKLDEA